VSHRKARLTPVGRALIVERVNAGWKQAHVAAAMGVSRKCVRKWLDRYAAEGAAGLEDRSSRPHSCPSQTPAHVEAKVLAERAKSRLGRDQVAQACGVPARTVSRILARHDVPHLAICDPITGLVIRTSPRDPVRYERDRPGDLIHMDVKKLGRIPDGGGSRVHGRGATGAQRHKSEPLGYDYIHVLIDDHSRLAYVERHDDETGPTCAAFLARGIDYFAEHAILGIHELMTDNALAYRFSLRDLCAELWINQLFIGAYKPWQNGKVERLHRTMLSEWAYRRPYTSNDQRTQHLAPRLEHYNTQRRHAALGGLPPISRL
jgi:transposase InsO family protein